MPAVMPVASGTDPLWRPLNDACRAGRLFRYGSCQPGAQRGATWWPWDCLGWRAPEFRFALGAAQACGAAAPLA
jgi:hypothetical protein